MDRLSVPLRYAYRLINHGPTTLVTSRAGTRANVMAAQWVMPVDYDPAKVALVLDRATYTYELFAESGVLGFSIPIREQASLVYRCGSQSGREHDKLSTVETFAGSVLDLPLVAGCLGWLEARVLRSPALDEVAAQFELVVLEVVAASADPRWWRDDRLQLDSVHTLHHLGGGVFRASGEQIEGR
jgi:flavin reductase (DIM6/NTAB) family NADH-FMN oxidoreductase RutF